MEGDGDTASVRDSNKDDKANFVRNRKQKLTGLLLLPEPILWCLINIDDDLNLV